jgi:cytochrome c-type biogenesis protein CcmH
MPGHVFGARVFGVRPRFWPLKTLKTWSDPVFCLLLLLFACTIASLAHAVQSEAKADDAELEARVQRVASELRCLVCQNQTIADSNAELAQDLRREVRTMLARGRSEAEVREFMTQRYGDFILYRPPFNAATLLLWVGPFLLLVAGVWVLRRIARNRRRIAGDPTLTPSEEARVHSLLSGENEAR